MENNRIYKNGRFLRSVGFALAAVMVITLLLHAFPLREEVFAADKITEEDIDDLQQMVDALEKKKEEQEDLLAQMEKDEVRLQAALASYGSLATL